ncbi:DUF1003 domain-containing protein [Sphingoaurantiacus capsulatus]|uniref:DUF1003 domain-containing protein n=1 Tax=Sphingoaurantiacus capsulatus TaxID=1771310 RepID=A0ABV7XEM6_9SPHN
MSDQPIDMVRLAERALATEPGTLPARVRHVVERAARRETVSRPHPAAGEGGDSFGQRLADRVAAVGGSWGFIAGFGLFLLGWALTNALLLTHPPDPYPFIFLNLLLSMLAAIQAPIIMMSQNRQVVRDRLQAQQDYEVNLKAELEILALHEKMDRVLAQLDERP